MALLSEEPAPDARWRLRAVPAPRPTAAMSSAVSCSLPQSGSLTTSSDARGAPGEVGGVLARSSSGASTHLFLLQGPRHLAAQPVAWKRHSCLGHWPHPRGCSRPLADPPDAGQVCCPRTQEDPGHQRDNQDILSLGQRPYRSQWRTPNLRQTSSCCRSRWKPGAGQAPTAP